MSAKTKVLYARRQSYSWWDGFEWGACSHSPGLLEQEQQSQGPLDVELEKTPLSGVSSPTQTSSGSTI